VQCDISIQSDLSKHQLISVIEEIVDPFYYKVTHDNATATFINNSEHLFRLKTTMSRFVIRFITRSGSELKEDWMRIAHGHNRIALQFEHFAGYFFIWSELVMRWVEKHITQDQKELCQWRSKMFQSFGGISESHVASLVEGQSKLAHPEHVTSHHSAPAMSTEKLSRVDLSQIDTMHFSDDVKISATAFLEEVGEDPELIQELLELEDDVREILYEEEGFTSTMLDVTIRMLDRYQVMLHNTLEFKELAFAISSLVAILQNLSPEKIEAKSLKRAFKLFEAVIGDLKGWRDVIFVSKEALDIHYLDASLFSSFAQIEVLLTPKSTHEESKEEEGDLELF